MPGQTHFRTVFSLALACVLLLLYPIRACTQQAPSGSDENSLVFKADAAYRSGQLDAARQLLEEALRLDPRLARAHALLGLVLARQNAVQGALRNLGEAHQIEPDNPDYAYDYAVLLLQGRRFAAAIPILEALHRRSPKADDVLVNLARAYAGTHESTKLSALPSALDSAQYTNESLLKTLATILAGNGQPVAVEQLWKAAINHDPNSPLPYAALAKLWIAGGDAHRAQALLAGAPPVARGPLYLYAQGETQMALRNYDPAISSFSKLIRQAPGNQVAWHELVKCNMLADRLSQADEDAQEAAGQFPGAVEFEYQQAVINYMLGRTTTAIRLLSPILEKGEGNDPRAALLMAVLRSQLGEYGEATRYFKRAETLDRGCNALTSYFYGTTLLRMHQTAPAAAQLRNAIHCRPHFGLAEFRLGQALLQSGLLHQALALLQQATQDDSTVAEPYYALAQVRRRLGDQAGAQADLRQFNALHKHIAHSDRDLFRPSEAEN
ncbi:MAG TPA: tetratricopeptide repeat protein [Terriglobia bacterium]|nr:tetratricopeptide repeat protein [Terriglobia bacterium]